MGTTLTGKRVQNTYDSLLVIDTDNLTGTPKRITDGLGNDSPLYLSTSSVGIGMSPTVQFQTSGNAQIGNNLVVGGDLTVNGTTTIIDSTIVAIGDNMIELAKDNAANIKDIGWYGTIVESGTKYVGMYYDASSGVSTPEFYIGVGTVEPSSTAAWTVKGKLIIGDIDSTGGTFSGQITIPETPTADGHAASKKYVDDQLTAQDLDIAGDSGTGSVDLDSQTFTIAGTSNEIETSASGQTLTVGIVTNPTLSGNVNITGNLTVDDYIDIEAASGYGRIEVGGPSGGYIDLKNPFSDDFDLRILCNGGTSQINALGGTLDITSLGGIDLQYNGSTKLTVISTGIDITGNLSVSGGIKDSDGDLGTSGQILSSTGTATNWIDFDDVNSAKAIEITVKNIEAITLTKGTVVHASPTASPPSGNVIEVKKADYDTASLMPGIAVLNEDITSTSEGQAVMMGAVSGFDTSSFSIGDELYVGNDGTFTNTKPTANNQLVQKIAVVIKSHASNGLIKVFGAGRSNDVPNEVDRNINFSDDSKLTFGDSTTPDLEIYHDGSNSYIETSTSSAGDLYIKAQGTNHDLYLQAVDDVLIRPQGGNNGIKVIGQGAVELYYNNSKKLETTSTGVSVTGGASFTDNIDINGNNKHIRFIDTYGNWLIEAGDGANNFKIHSQSLAADYLTLEGGGQLNLGEYGSGSFTGTATYRLAVDSSGDVIEIPIGDGAVDGSGATGQVAFWTDTDTIDGENNLYWDSTNDRLGIGTNLPNAKTNIEDGHLLVSQSANTTQENILLQGAGYHIGSTLYGNVSIRSNYNNSTNSGTLNFYTAASGTNTAERMRITSGGSVGIGTDSPQAKLEINLSGSENQLLLTQGTTDHMTLLCGTVGAGIVVEDDNYFAIWHQDYANRAGQTGLTERMRIDSSGNTTFKGNVTTESIFQVHSTGASAVIGAVGNTANDVNIYSTSAGHNGLRMHINGILPTDNTGTIIDNDADLGDPSYRFKTLYLGGNANLGASSYLRFTAATSGSDASVLFGNTAGTGGSLTFKRNSDAATILTLNADTSATFAGMITVNGGGIDIDNNDDVRLRFDNASVFKAGLQVATTSGDMIAGSAVNDFAIRAQENMLFATGGNTERMRIDSSGVVDITGGILDMGQNRIDGSSDNLKISADNSSVSGLSTIEFLVDGSEKMRINNSGNVGIGVSPYSFAQLHIYDTSDIYIAIQKGTANGYIINDGTNISLASDQGSTGKKLLVNRNAPDNSLIIDSSGLVRFTVDSGTASAIDIGYISSARTIRAVETGGGNARPLTLLAQNFTFKDDSATRMTIDSSGNVGIGTGSGTLDEIFEIKSGNGAGGDPATNAPVMKITNNTTSSSWVSGNKIGGIEYWTRDPSGNAPYVTSFINSINDQSGTQVLPSGALVFGTATYNAVGGAVERMRIDSSGNVGIGTDSPNRQLSIYGTNDGYMSFDGGRTGNHEFVVGSDSAGFIIYDDTLDTYRFVIDQDSGNVGINETSPDKKLHIVDTNAGSVTYPLRLQNSGTTTGTDVGLIFTTKTSGGGSASSVIRSESEDTSGNSSLVFTTPSGGSTAERLRIDSSGNVGILNTDPQAFLHIGGPTPIGAQALIARGNAAGTYAVSIEQDHVEGWGMIIDTDSTVSGDPALKIVNPNGTLFEVASNGDVEINGKVGINETSPINKVHITSADDLLWMEDTSGNANTEFVIFQAPGYTPIGSIIRNGSAGSILYNTSSDYRLKEDLQDFNALDLVDNITAYDYKWKDTEQRDYGFVAHELQEVMPNVVTGEKDGEMMQGVDYAKLTPVLLKAIQEQQEIINDLKSRIEILENN